MGNIRRKFGTEVKREAVRQAMQPGNAVATVAQDLGVHESVLRRWVKELGARVAGKATDRPLKNARSQEIERLKRELVRVKPTARPECGATFRTGARPAQRTVCPV